MNCKIFLFFDSAAYVQMLTVSKLSKGLFHRAIVQSGAASNPWGLITMEDSLQKLNAVAKAVNCPAGDSKALVECLRAKDVQELIRVYDELFHVRVLQFVAVNPFV